eukprot:CAMPEP_0116882868 /NCGR_PEP_ID=MMETSP0463-20121206/15270_1 /TAXON_ID=181622 /ORGANISM="Strombidinopsis sp, Strain SopsisLIS2011" /LENGTH=52 /DNA_ID=CAMNT_0004536823 /DNA_START=21 /DNA_END=179 /DNA_ORIENTATION=+
MTLRLEVAKRNYELEAIKHAIKKKPARNDHPLASALDEANQNGNAFGSSNKK